MFCRHYISQHLHFQNWSQLHAWMICISRHIFFLPLSVPEPDLSGVFTLHRMDRYQVGSWSPLVHSAGVMCFHATGRWYSEKIEHPSWPINKYYLNTILIFPLLKKKKKKTLLMSTIWRLMKRCWIMQIFFTLWWIRTGTLTTLKHF